jgi:hypothetical protein
MLQVVGEEVECLMGWRPGARVLVKADLFGLRGLMGMVYHKSWKLVLQQFKFFWVLPI